MLLQPRWPLFEKFINYLIDEENMKGVTRDLWDQSELFSREHNTSVSNYDDSSSWHSCFDGFVEQMQKGK